MVEYWASKASLPYIPSGEGKSSEYITLENLSASTQGVTVAQGQPDLLGAVEMLCALQYHYQNFVRIVRDKGAGKIDVSYPDERFEAVAYVGRLGQLCYFSESVFVEAMLQEKTGPDFIPSAFRLLHFRHKYAAHRERDKPLKGSAEGTELGGELALGALGGLFFSARPDRQTDGDNSQPANWNDLVKRNYRDWYVSFQIFKKGEAIYFIPEIDHPRIIAEASVLLNRLIEIAKARAA
jgi:hypothetical protein